MLQPSRVDPDDFMPIVQFSKLVSFSDRCGTEIPRWMRKRFEAFDDDAASIKSFGEEIVFNLCQKLLSGGAPGLHFYTLNQTEPSLQLVKLLGLPKNVAWAIAQDL